MLLDTGPPAAADGAMTVSSSSGATAAASASSVAASSTASRRAGRPAGHQPHQSPVVSVNGNFLQRHPSGSGGATAVEPSPPADLSKPNLVTVVKVGSASVWSGDDARSLTSFQTFPRAGVASTRRATTGVGDASRDDVPAIVGPLNQLSRRRPTDGDVATPAGAAPAASILTVVIPLANGDRRFGFSVIGGVDERFAPKIEAINPGSPADRADVQVGDEILEVNGRPLDQCTHTEVISHIHQCIRARCIQLKLQRRALGEASATALEPRPGSVSSSGSNLELPPAPAAQVQLTGDDDRLSAAAATNLVVIVDSQGVHHSHHQQQQQQKYQHQQQAVQGGRDASAGGVGPASQSRPDHNHRQQQQQVSSVQLNAIRSSTATLGVGSDVSLNDLSSSTSFRRGGSATAAGVPAVHHSAQHSIEDNCAVPFVDPTGTVSPISALIALSGLQQPVACAAQPAQQQQHLQHRLRTFSDQFSAPAAESSAPGAAVNGLAADALQPAAIGIGQTTLHSVKPAPGHSALASSLTPGAQLSEPFGSSSLAVPVPSPRRSPEKPLNVPIAIDCYSRLPSTSLPLTTFGGPSFSRPANARPDVGALAKIPNNDSDCSDYGSSTTCNNDKINASKATIGSADSNTVTKGVDATRQLAHQVVAGPGVNSGSGSGGPLEGGCAAAAPTASATATVFSSAISGAQSSRGAAAVSTPAPHSPAVVAVSAHAIPSATDSPPVAVTCANASGDVPPAVTAGPVAPAATTESPPPPPPPLPPAATVGGAVGVANERPPAARPTLELSSGVHREMAVDVPDAFVPMAKQAPRYPPTRPLSDTFARHGDLLKPLDSNVSNSANIRNHGRNSVATSNGSTTAFGGFSGPGGGHKNRSLRGLSINNSINMAASSGSSNSLTPQEQQMEMFLRSSIRQSKRLRDLEKFPAPLTSRGVVNDAFEPEQPLAVLCSSGSSSSLNHSTCGGAAGAPASRPNSIGSCLTATPLAAAAPAAADAAASVKNRSVLNGGSQVGVSHHQQQGRALSSRHDPSATTSAPNTTIIAGGGGRAAEIVNAAGSPPVPAGHQHLVVDGGSGQVMGWPAGGPPVSNVVSVGSVGVHGVGGRSSLRNVDDPPSVYDIELLQAALGRLAEHVKNERLAARGDQGDHAHRGPPPALDGGIGQAGPTPEAGHVAADSIATSTTERAADEQAVGSADSEGLERVSRLFKTAAFQDALALVKQIRHTFYSQKPPPTPVGCDSRKLCAEVVEQCQQQDQLSASGTSQVAPGGEHQELRNLLSQPDFIVLLDCHDYVARMLNGRNSSALLNQTPSASDAVGSCRVPVSRIGSPCSIESGLHSAATLVSPCGPAEGCASPLPAPPPPQTTLDGAPLEVEHHRVRHSSPDACGASPLGGSLSCGGGNGGQPAAHCASDAATQATAPGGNHDHQGQPPATTASRRVIEPPAELAALVDEAGDNARLIRIDKGRSPLGATVRNEGESIVVGRVVLGGAAYRSGLLHEGDEIVAVNGVEMRGKTVGQVSDELAAMTGQLSMLIIPSDRYHPSPPAVAHVNNRVDNSGVSGASLANGHYSQHQQLQQQSQEQHVIHLRANFDYDPEDDMYIPCRELGIAFDKGDILHVINMDDPNWWQAYRDTDYQKSSLAGLIPSRSFQMRRETIRQQLMGQTGNGLSDEDRGGGKKHRFLCTPTMTKKSSPSSFSSNRSRSLGKVSRKGFKGGKLSHSVSLGSSGATDSEDMLLYEEVGLYYPRANWKRPLVLVGPSGTGKHEIRLKLMEDTTRFAAAISHTTRPPKNFEIEGRDFYFVSRSQFETDVHNNRFVEFGEFERHYYGTSVHAIQSVMSSGLICVLNTYPEALKLLRRPDIKPYIVFIAPPSLEKLRQNRTKTGASVKTEELKEIIEQAREMEDKFGQYFDSVIINHDHERAYRELLKELAYIEREPQWVPRQWLESD